MADILIINGNPKQTSYCKSLAHAYKKSAESSGTTVLLFHIADLDFNPNLSDGYDGQQPFENDLITLQKEIKTASHIVIISPIWWATVPAKLKGLLDRVLLPNYAFKYNTGYKMPDQLLKGKTARLIVTMDTPSWYYRFVQGDPIVKTLNAPTLKLCGIKLKHISRFGMIRSSTDKQRAEWISTVEKAAMLDAKHLG